VIASASVRRDGGQRLSSAIVASSIAMMAMVGGALIGPRNQNRPLSVWPSMALNNGVSQRTT